MKRSITVSTGFALAAAMLLLAGCGLAEVGASAATQGASAAEQAKQAKETEARFQQKLDQANQAAAEQRAKAEAQSQ
jgi:cell division protein FtsX